MKYAVLGSDSFSGQHMCDYLRERGDRVFPFGRRFDINLHIDEIMDLLNATKPDYIINFIAKGLVAESWAAPCDWVQTNVLSMTRLIDRLKQFPIQRYIHVSTPEVYGSGVHSEGSAYNPSTPYAVSKAAMEMMLRAYWKAYQFPVVFTRSANVYGPRQEKRLIPLAMDHKKNGTAFQMHGDGSSLRSFIHIRDVCAATKLLCEKGERGEAYNIATKDLVSVKELLDMIGCKYESVPDRLAKDAAYRLTSGKMRILGWTDMITLEKGLDEVWASR